MLWVALNIELNKENGTWVVKNIVEQNAVYQEAAKEFKTRKAAYEHASLVLENWCETLMEHENVRRAIG